MPQLYMRRRLDELPEAAVPARYAIRRLQEGELGAWARVLDATGELGEWDVDRARRAVAGPGWRVLADSIHLVWHRHPDACEGAAAAVGTACIQYDPDAGEGPPELGWVAVAPGHQGRGLGRQVSLAVMRHMRERGFAACFLRTDDHRLPALRLYLAMGFEPWYRADDDAERWRRIRKRLKA